MSACEFSGRLSGYYDGRIAPAERAQIESHLKTCPACAQELKQLQAIGDSVRAASRLNISTDALSRMHLAVQDAFDVVIFRFVSRLTAVAAAILLTGGLWLISTQDNQAQASAPAAWERVAIAPSTAAESTSPNSNDVQLAEWIVTDLSAREERQ